MWFSAGLDPHIGILHADEYNKPTLSCDLMEPYLICYDIEDNYLRMKLGNSILDAGFDRINLSVYLGTTDKVSLSDLERKIAKLVKDMGKENDRVTVIPIQAHEIHNMRVFGKNDLDRGS